LHNRKGEENGKRLRSYICNYHYLTQENNANDGQAAYADLQQTSNENLIAQQQKLLFHKHQKTNQGVTKSPLCTGF